MKVILALLKGFVIALFIFVCMVAMVILQQWLTHSMDLVLYFGSLSDVRQ